MISYVLVNDMEKKEFENKYQLPYGCWNTAIYKELKLAVRMLDNMTQITRCQYCIEIWENGVFVEVVVKGDDLI